MSSNVAVKVSITSITSEILKTAVLEVVTNPKYSSAMKLRSQRFRDQPLKPLDLAIWWAEYLIRDPNPTHLKSPTKSIGFIKSNLIDVAAIAIFLFLWTLYIVKKLFNLLKSSLAVSNDKKDKKNN